MWLSLTQRTVPTLAYRAVELGERLCSCSLGRAAGTARQYARLWQDCQARAFIAKMWRGDAAVTRRPGWSNTRRLSGSSLPEM